jgi:hypothetical protein
VDLQVGASSFYLNRHVLTRCRPTTFNHNIWVSRSPRRQCTTNVALQKEDISNQLK